MHGCSISCYYRHLRGFGLVLLRSRCILYCMSRPSARNSKEQSLLCTVLDGAIEAMEAVQGICSCVIKHYLHGKLHSNPVLGFLGHRRTWLGCLPQRVFPLLLSAYTSRISPIDVDGKPPQAAADYDLICEPSVASLTHIVTASMQPLRQQSKTRPPHLHV